jgi:phosphoglycerate dehydrogenase-like enzyme
MNDDQSKRRPSAILKDRTGLGAKARTQKDSPLLILHDRPDTYLTMLRERFPEMPIEACSQADGIEEALREQQPLVVLSYKCSDLPAPVHRPILDCPSVEWIHVGGAGVEHLVPWDPVKVTLSNSSGILAPFMAETIIGAILMLNFGFHRYLRQQATHHWQGHSWRPLAGQTLLVLGLGNIGRRVAAKAKGQGMRVIGVRNRPQKPEEIDELFPMSRLKEALAAADFVALHLPLTDDTHHLIDAEALSAMRSSAYLINGARGPVVDEQALVEALRNKEIAGAYLDVFEEEPLPAASPLWDLENVVISPHVADSITDWEERFARFFADNLERWLKGAAVANVVDPARGY